MAEEKKAQEEIKVPLMDTSENKGIPKTVFIVTSTKLHNQEDVPGFVTKHGYVAIVQQMNELYQYSISY